MLVGLRGGQKFAQYKVEKIIAGQTHETKPQYDRDLCAHLAKQMFDFVHIRLVCSRTSDAKRTSPPGMIGRSPEATMRSQFVSR